MSNAVSVKAEHAAIEWTQDEIKLIKETVAKGATDAEFKVFLYRCRKMQLDPLKSGQIYFVKYGQGPGTIVVGLDGFRARAARTGLHTGTKRGIVRDDNGRCIGAWAEVYRKDWDHPAREEVSLAEYNTNKGQWGKMPETMIKKVAEVAALRMAFPDELGDLKSPEEMEQAEERKHQPQPKPRLADRIKESEPEVVEGQLVEDEKFPFEAPRSTITDSFQLPGGKYKGMKLGDKPKEFWGKYCLEVQAALSAPDFPKHLRDEAVAIVEVLEEYLGQ